jgi:hypothetical protein
MFENWKKSVCENGGIRLFDVVGSMRTRQEIKGFHVNFLSKNKVNTLAPAIQQDACEVSLNALFKLYYW